MTDWAKIVKGLLFYAYILRYTKWEVWSLTITNSVQCLEEQLKLSYGEEKEKNKMKETDT